MALTQVPSSMLANAGYELGLRNRIINGDMRIAQRSTSAAIVSGSYVALDRWLIYSGGNSGVMSQVASGLAGFQYALKIQRNAGQTSVSGLQINQALETVNSIPLQGQTVTLSFYAKAGANFSGGVLNPFVATGTGTDQAALNIGSWTGNTFVVNANTPALTTTWTRYSYTGVVPSNATQIGVAINASFTGTAGVDDSYYVTGVQLEVGSAATPFEYRPYGMELALCQRYYQKTYNQSVAPGSASTLSMANLIANGATGTNYSFFSFIVPMRAAPTVSVWDGNGNANAFSRYQAGAWTHNTTSSIAPTNSGENSFAVSYAGTPFTTGTTWCLHYAATAEL